MDRATRSPGRSEEFKWVVPDVFSFAVQYQLKKKKKKEHLIISQDIVVTVTEEMSYLLCDAHYHYITFECSFIEMHYSRNGEERCPEAVSPFRAALRQEQVDNLKALVHDQDKLFPVST